MPDVSYKIIIEEFRSGAGATGDASSSSASGGGSNSGKGSQDASDGGWLSDIYGAYKAIQGFAPVAAAGSVAKNLITWQVGLVGRNMGNSLVQQKINFGMQVASQVATTGGLFIGGLMTGNPLMLLGAATSAINTVIGYAKQAEQFTYDRGMENVSRALLMERAGPSFNRSRLEVAT